MYALKVFKLLSVCYWSFFLSFPLKINIGIEYGLVPHRGHDSVWTNDDNWFTAAYIRNVAAINWYSIAWNYTENPTIT